MGTMNTQNEKLETAKNKLDEQMKKVQSKSFGPGNGMSRSECESLASAAAEYARLRQQV